MGNMFDTSDDTAPVTQDDFDFEGAGNAAEGAEAKEPDAQQQAQGAEDGNKAPEDEGNAKEELILGKYKTTEDLAKAHESLQKRLGDMRNELGNLRKQAAQPQEQEGQQQQQSSDSGWDDKQWDDFDKHMSEQYSKRGWRAIWELAVDAARQTVTPLQEVINSEQLTKAQTEAVDSELSLLGAVDEEGNAVFPDAGELIHDMEAFLDRHPYFIDLLVSQHQNRRAGKLPDTDTGVLEVLYKAVKADKVEGLGRQAYAKGVQQGAAQAQAKAGAGMQKPGAKQTNTEPSPEEQIVNDIFAHKRGGFFI